MPTRLHTLCIIVILFYSFYSCKDKSSTETKTDMVAETSAEDSSMANIIERGKYLVTIMDCVVCHTPKKMTEKGPVPDMDRYMMGFDGSQPLPPVPEQVPIGPWVLFNGELTAIIGPWGTSFAANLTPHNTGLGSWTIENFKKAMREGKFKGIDESRPIMPPMPIEAYKHLKDEDLEAIFAYLRTIEPIENIVPGYIPPKGT